MIDTNEEFLELINDKVIFRDGKVQPRKNRRGEDLFDNGSAFIFLKPMDVVVEGPCSDWTDMIRPKHWEPGAPFGYTNISGQPRRSYIDYLCEEVFPEGTKTVLVFATCCGSYTSREWREAVRKAKPDIEWNFPSVPDFYRCVNDTRHLINLVEALMKAEIIGVQQ